MNNAPQARPRSSARRITAAAVRWSVNAVLVLAVVAFAALAIGPHLFGYRTATMLTGSMAPYIQPGDVIFDTELATSDIEVGDVITYQIPVDDHRVVSHRVTEVTHLDNGSVTIQTKGDANAAVDPWTAQIDEPTVWEVRAVVPVVGHAIRALRTPAVHAALLWVAPTILVMLLLSAIWSSGGSKTSPAPAGAAREERALATPVAVGAAE